MSQLFEQKYKQLGKQVSEILLLFSLDLIGIIVEYARELQLVQTIKLDFISVIGSRILVQSNGNMVVCFQNVVYVFNLDGKQVQHFTAEHYISNIAVHSTSNKIIANVLELGGVTADKLMEMDQKTESPKLIMNTPILPNFLGWVENKYMMIRYGLSSQSSRLVIHEQGSSAGVSCSLADSFKDFHQMCFSTRGDLYCLKYIRPDRFYRIESFHVHIETQDKEKKIICLEPAKTMDLKEQVFRSLTGQICHVNDQNQMVLLETGRMKHIVSLYNSNGGLDARLEIDIMKTHGVSDVCLDSKGRVYMLFLDEIRIYDFL